MIIREVTQKDFSEWLRMRKLLYCGCDTTQQLKEINTIFFNRTVEGEIDYAVWVCHVSIGRLAGFVEISLRENAPLCRTRPIGYVESLFVDPDFRRKGVASRLLRKGQSWVTKHQCGDFYADTEPSPSGAMAFYEGFGFHEIVSGKSEILYRKKLNAALG